MQRGGSVFNVGNRAARRAASRAARRRRGPVRRAGIRLAACSGLLAAITCLGGTAARAGAFEVVNLDDAGPGSLRDAILAANGTPGPDVITFATGLAGTITLATGQLTITDSLEIGGPGRGLLTIDGNATSRIFDVPLSPGAVDVYISGMTITNGQEARGGGIRVQDETLTLDDVALIGNTASGEGGGLYADGFAMTLTVRNSTISGNTAFAGGGAYVEDTGGATTFEGVVIDGNTATQQGGGIFFYDPDNDVVIDHATITNNVAGKGGGIYLYSQDGGSFTVSNSTISGNQATSGGGVLLYDIDHPVSIANSTISGNSAVDGAGVEIGQISAPAVISNSTISGNTATGTGGGVRLARGGGLTVNHSTITQNSAPVGSGGKFPGPVSFSHVIVAGNTGGGDLIAAGGVTADFSLIGGLVGAVTDGGGNQLGITDPMLGPLADNGGPTQTHLPLPGSPAIDAGNPAAAAPATDQRGMARVVDIIDIGSVETDLGVIQLDATTVTVAENAGTLTVSATRTGAAGVPATVDIATAGGTALAPGDFGSVSTQLSWAAGEVGTKTITIPLVLDAAHEPDETFTVALSGVSGARLGANTVLTVTLQDWNTAPTVSGIGDITRQLGIPLDPLTVHVGDAEQPASALVVTASSSNQAVVADGGIVVSGTGTHRTLDITALAVGTTTITVTVSDGVLTTTETFVITITAPSPVNTAPTISELGDLTTPLGHPLDPVTVHVGDAEQPASALVVTVSSSNQAVVADSGIVVSGTGAHRTIVLTASAVGTTTITVTVSDGALTATETFTVTVTPPPPPPPPSGPEACGDGIDNDGDGGTDEGCGDDHVTCSDGVDDDFDGWIDEGCLPPAPAQPDHGTILPLTLSVPTSAAPPD